MTKNKKLLASLIALSAASLGAPESAEAQVYVGPPVYAPAPRWRFRLRVPRVVVMPPPYYMQPPPVYVQPAPPPPPVYVQPAPPPPVYVQPAPPPPVYVQPAPPPPPVYVQQPPPPPQYYPQAPYYPQQRVARRPGWPATVGLGLRLSGVLSNDDLRRFGHLGIGGELLFRVHRHIGLELGGEYQKAVYGENDANQLQRYDIPVTFGARFHLGGPEWVLSPYLVIATGVNYGKLDYIAGQDTAWYALGQFGGGLELRLGKRVGITADVRGEGRRRLNAPDAQTASLTYVNGKPFVAQQDQLSGLLRLGVAVYF